MLQESVFVGKQGAKFLFFPTKLCCEPNRDGAAAHEPLFFLERYSSSIYHFKQIQFVYDEALVAAAAMKTVNVTRFLHFCL